MGRRKPLEPLQVDGVVYECSHKRIWPPIEVIAYQTDLIDPLPPGVPIAEAFRGVLSDVVHQRIRTWEQVCGQREMSLQKCPGCRFSLKDGTPTTVVGTGLTHTIHTPHPKKKRQ
ncbi:MAG: hypothetical protein CMJ67_10700 [Planctomycetaceae bacterium]|nr:hypothetical protein [Planctomycetaceae bacterium]